MQSKILNNDKFHTKASTLSKLSNLHVVTTLLALYLDLPAYMQ